MKDKGFQCPKCNGHDVEFDRLDSWNEPLEDWMACHSEECHHKGKVKEFLPKSEEEEHEVYPM